MKNYQNETTKALEKMAIAILKTEALVSASKAYNINEMDSYFALLSLESMLDNRRNRVQETIKNDSSAIFASC